MFKRISCIALGAILTSLTASVGPTYAASIRSGNFESFTTPTSLGSLSNQPAGFGGPDLGVNSTGLISQADTSEGGDNELLARLLAMGGYAALVLLAGDFGGGDDASPTIVSPISIDPDDPDVEDPDNPDVDDPDNPIVDDPDDPIVDDPDLPAPIPTPALLPGLIGMGMAAVRKRNLAKAS